MEVAEISSRMDYALQKHKAGIILDEYNKSLYLTKAQAQFVTQVIGVYEYTDAMRHVLGPLIIRVDETTPVSTNGDYYIYDEAVNIKTILYEYINDIDDDIMVIPLDFNDIHKTRPNPFRKPYDKLAYRITSDKKLTIFSSVIVTEYHYDYCKEPVAIVLEALAGTGLDIQGVVIATKSELPYDSVLQVIDLAVQLAIQEAATFSKKEPPEQVKK